MANPPSSPVLIDKFWESVPPAWRQTRSQIHHNAVEKFKMTEEQFQVLRRIRNGSVSVSALAETSQTSRSAVSKAVELAGAPGPGGAQPEPAGPTQPAAGAYGGGPAGDGSHLR